MIVERAVGRTVIRQVDWIRTGLVTVNQKRGINSVTTTMVDDFVFFLEGDMTIQGQTMEVILKWLTAMGHANVVRCELSNALDPFGRIVPITEVGHY